MNNNDCNVARDLMPLVIDQVASEESRALVETHFADCEPCAQVFTDMQAKVPEKGDAAEDNSFSAAMRQLRRTVGWRRLKVFVSSVIIMLILLVVGKWCNQFFLVEYNRDMPLDWYNMTLSRTKDGSGIITWDFLKTNGSHEMRVETTSGIIVLGSQCPYIAPKLEKGRTRRGFPLRLGIRWKDGVGFVFERAWSQENTTDAVVKEIRMGTEDDYKILYQQGGDVPLCSDKMETMFLLLKKHTDAQAAVNKAYKDLTDFYDSMDSE